MLLSGGIDSATCLYYARREGYEVRALTISFYHIARGELRAARGLARAARVKEHRMVSIPELREASDIAGSEFPNRPPTYIPQRNSIFYGLAANYAEEVGADYIIGGHNKDDQAAFDDTRDLYFEKLQEAFWAASSALRFRRTSILRPLKTKTKPEVIRYASALGVPLELTWSCHREGWRPCLRCEGCRARVRNFALAGIDDPASHESLRARYALRKS